MATGRRLEQQFIGLQAGVDFLWAHWRHYRPHWQCPLDAAGAPRRDG